MSDPVGRDEFQRLVARLDTIDASGTRGVAVLAVQVQQLGANMARHEEKHDREAAQRSSNRKWVFMAIVGLVAAIDGPIVTVLFTLLHR